MLPAFLWTQLSWGEFCALNVAGFSSKSMFDESEVATEGTLLLFLVPTVPPRSYVYDQARQRISKIRNRNDDPSSR